MEQGFWEGPRTGDWLWEWTGKGVSAVEWVGGVGALVTFVMEFGWQILGLIGISNLLMIK